jgi:hypothetical protein
LHASTAFEVRAAHNGDSIVFNETDKVDTTSASLLRTEPEYTSLYVYDANYHPWDILKIKFDDLADPNQDNNDDGSKLLGGDLNFYSFSADKKKQAIDARPYLADEVIPLGITSNYAQEFIIRAEQIVVPENATLYLHDKLKGVYVELAQGTEYRFNVDKDKASQGDNRFELSAKPATVAAQSNSGLQMELSPNPTSAEVKVNYQMETNQAISLRITSMTGVTVYQKDLGTSNAGTCTIPVRDLAAGMYLVEITSGKQKATRQLIKK